MAEAIHSSSAIWSSGWPHRPWEGERGWNWSLRSLPAKPFYDSMIHTHRWSTWRWSSLINLHLVHSYFIWHNKLNSTYEKAFSLNHNKDQGQLFQKENWSPYGEQVQSLLYLFCICWNVIPLCLVVPEYSWSKINQGLSFLRQCSLVAFIPHQKEKAVMSSWPHTKDIWSAQGARSG